MKKIAIALFLFGFLPGAGRAQGILDRKQPLVENGNRAFSEQHYQKALEAYEQAEGQLQNEPRLHFNRGGALFKLERYAEAREAFLRAMGVEDPVLKKKNLYNIGNTFLAEGALSDAAAYYRRVLELDPEDDDARYNLELVLRAQQQQKEKEQKESKNKQKQGEQQKKGDQQKEQQQDQQQQPQNQEGQKEQDRDQQKQDQQQGQQEEKEKERQQQQQASEQQQSGQEKEPSPPQEQQQLAQAQPNEAERQQPPSEQRSLTPQQIEAILRAIREGERPFQMQRFVLPELSRRQVEKDW